MLITDSEALRGYGESMRIWQGMAGIEVSSGGRSFVSFCTNGTAEQLGNFVILMSSDDGAKYRTIALAKDDGHRCFDPCVWIDPLDRLWFIWSYEPDHAVWAAICNDPDGESIRFGEPFKIGNDVMLNKPTVLSTGEWLFPIAVWQRGVRVLGPKYDTKEPSRGSFVYKTNDNGISFSRIGCADVPNRSYDEHMILELLDGRLMMLVRTSYGIGASYSYDRGVTWTKGVDSGIGGPCSRFHIRRLRSGRVLLINHADGTGRSKLTAYLSEDDCRSWKYSLVIDERDNVAAPDAKEADDGFIHIVYDYDRGSFAKSLKDAYKCAREIITAKITEADIMAGRLITEGSRLKTTISKLGKYEGTDNPYKEDCRYSNKDFALKLIDLPSKEDIIEAVFDAFPLDTSKSFKLDIEKFDGMIEEFIRAPERDMAQLTDIIAYLRNSVAAILNLNPLVERVKAKVSENLSVDTSEQDIAKSLGTGVYYLCHVFKKITGMTISDYKNSIRLTRAKQLLVGTDMKMTEISVKCGYGTSSYFSKLFKKSEGISPLEYRRFNKSYN